MNLIRLLCAVLAMGWLESSAVAKTAELVTNTRDSGAGSLRQAILDVTANGGGQIDFRRVTGTLTLVSPLPALSGNISITGPGANQLTVSGNNLFQVFSVSPGASTTLAGLTIADGKVTNVPYGPLTFGAGISNAGCLRLVGCTVRNCTNYAVGFSLVGGGIYNAGQMWMEHCQVTDCAVAAYLSQSGPGGGLANDGELRMSDCVVSNCWAYYGGGIANHGNLLLSNCDILACISGPQADGGGIYNGPNSSLTLQSCTVSDCLAFYGGGVESWGDCAITDSSIVGNESGFFGGGVNVAQGKLVLLRSTFSDNDAGIGGGIGNEGGTLTLFNCTLSGNQGGGVQGEAYLEHCTVVSNKLYGASGQIRAQNNIFALNENNDISGTLVSEGYNLLGNPTGCTLDGDQTGNIYWTDPRLGPLQDNGGLTFTHALLPGSPAIDQGCVGGLTTDQRGAPRPFDVPHITKAADGSDIGSFEWHPDIRGFLHGHHHPSKPGHQHHHRDLPSWWPRFHMPEKGSAGRWEAAGPLRSREARGD